MARNKGIHLRPSPQRELPLQLQRKLYQLIESFYDHEENCDVDGLAEAVARFAFDHNLVWVPDDARLRAEGCFFYPVTPHDVKPVWLVEPSTMPGKVAMLQQRPPSLRELGAQPLDEGKRA